MTPPRRRWFAFSLRTLFVLFSLAAIPLGWLGYRLNWMQERHKVLQIPPPSWSEIFMGDECFAQFIEVSIGDGAAEIDRMRRLFPEAEVRVIPLPSRPRRLPKS